MQKLKLNLEDLKVKSFDTSPFLIRPHGTVLGQEPDETMQGTVCDSTGCQSNVTGCGGCGESAQSCGCPTQDDLTCFAGCTVYDTCWCANESRPGWESCGTTCMEPSCEDPGTCEPS